MAKEKKPEPQAISKKAPAVPARGMSPFEEMEHMFDSLFGRAWPRGWMHPFQWERPAWAELAPPFAGRWPKVDVIDRENELLIRAELPGVRKEDLDVSMTDNTVTVRGRSSSKKEEKKDNYYRSEISQGEFTRTVALPCEVDSSKAVAKLEDGVLELTLPKVEKSKRRTIKVA